MPWADQDFVSLLPTMRDKSHLRFVKTFIKLLLKGKPMENDHPKRNMVMVVEDTESDIDILVECLSDAYRVRVAMDGPSALEDIQKEPPDVILLDIMMPGMDGYEICRRIKQNKKTRDVLVIFVTALSEAVDETRGFELGAVDYITKPFSFSVIRARIKTHLDLSEARKELQQQNELLKENLKLRELVEQITRHDLKNPLQVIMGSVGMLALDISHFENDNIARQIQLLEKSCYTMLNMINRSLDLYKMETGSYFLNARKMDILPLLDRVIFGLENLIQSMDLKVDVTINGHSRASGERFSILTDELLFYSMMSNLVKNAAEASPKAGRIEISFLKNEGIKIHIQNQGTVNSQIRSRFFEKFVTFGKHGGVGLGTYSARLMAEMHGGTINFLTSDEKNKTIVAIHLPNPDFQA